MAQISKQLKKNIKLSWVMKNQVGDNMHQQINMKGGVGPPLAVRWFRLGPPKAEGTGSVPGWGLRSHIPRGQDSKT